MSISAKPITDKITFDLTVEDTEGTKKKKQASVETVK